MIATGVCLRGSIALVNESLESTRMFGMGMDRQHTRNVKSRPKEKESKRNVIINFN
jgi:hypothetical protein